MLLRTRKSARWRWLTLLLLVALTAAYLGYAAGQFPHGGSWPGIAFGVLALLLIALLLGFGIRKRSYGSRLGTLEGWLQAHVYLGLLTVVVVLFHAGFRLQDKVATAAFWVLVGVVVTGLYGAVLYTVLPRRLTEVQGDDTPEALAAEIRRIERSMERAAEGRSETFRRLARRLVEDARPGTLAGWRLLVEAGRQGRDREESQWESLLARVGADEEAPLRQLLVRSRQHKELLRRLKAQQHYRNLLDVWLWLHVPLSLGLAVLVLAHLVAVFYYWGIAGVGG